MVAILGLIFKISVIVVIFLVPIYIVSSLFGKSNNKKGRSSGGFFAILIYLVIALVGGSLVLFGLDEGSKGSVVTGSAIAGVALILAFARMRRRRY